MNLTDARTADTSAIVPFRIHIEDRDLNDLQSRLRNARWPSGVSDAPWVRGVPELYLRELVEYWHSRFDWRAQENALNSFPQFTTSIDGQVIHFIHAQSGKPGALPVILTHGWPSSNVEFLKIIDPLTHPERHGGSAEDALDLVIPSLPGSGFSTLLFSPDGATCSVLLMPGSS